MYGGELKPRSNKLVKTEEMVKEKDHRMFWLGIPIFLVRIFEVHIHVQLVLPPLKMKKKNKTINNEESMTSCTYRGRKSLSH